MQGRQGPAKASSGTFRRCGPSSSRRGSNPPTTKPNARGERPSSGARAASAARAWQADTSSRECSPLRRRHCDRAVASSSFSSPRRPPCWRVSRSPRCCLVRTSSNPQGNDSCLMTLGMPGSRARSNHWRQAHPTPLERCPPAAGPELPPVIANQRHRLPGQCLCLRTPWTGTRTRPERHEYHRGACLRHGDGRPPPDWELSGCLRALTLSSAGPLLRNAPSQTPPQQLKRGSHFREDQMLWHGPRFRSLIWAQWLFARRNKHQGHPPARPQSANQRHQQMTSSSVNQLLILTIRNSCAILYRQ